MSNVTALLAELDSGENPKSANDLLKAVYEELRIIARAKMAKERPGHTLQATILVHEAWLKIFKSRKQVRFKSRSHFFGTAANVMRYVLVDHARKRLAIKRGIDPQKTEFTSTDFPEIRQDVLDELVEAVDEALKEVYAKDKIAAKLVELKFFVGLNMKEVAEVMKISVSSAERLYRKFKKDHKDKFKGLV